MGRMLFREYSTCFGSEISLRFGANSLVSSANKELGDFAVHTNKRLKGTH